MIALPSVALLALTFLVVEAHGIDVAGLFKGGVPLLPNEPWYMQTYEFRLIRTDVKAKPFDFRYEALLLLVAFAYLTAHQVGRMRNRSVASTWLQAAMPLLEDEFAFVGKEPAPSGHHWGIGEGKGRLVWNGGAEALAYASGRRGVESLHVLFSLAPWHDPIELLYRFANNLATASSASAFDDVLSLTFQLPFQQPDNVSGVFAIVNKGVLRESRKGRFDLTFAKVLDGEQINEQRQLDARYAIMSEAGELTDVLLGEIGDRGNAQRQRVGLQSALNNIAAGDWLHSLVLSDQPEQRPETGAIPIEKRSRLLTLTMRVPRSAKQAKASMPLVEAACNLLDAIELGHARLSNATMNKLRQTRTQVDKDLQEEASREAKEEEEEARQAAKRKAEQEKFDKLSPAEQEKRKQVEKKRQQRKAQGKSQMKAR